MAIVDPTTLIAVKEILTSIGPELVKTVPEAFVLGHDAVEARASVTARKTAEKALHPKTIEKVEVAGVGTFPDVDPAMATTKGFSTLGIGYNPNAQEYKVPGTPSPGPKKTPSTPDFS